MDLQDEMRRIDAILQGQRHNLEEAYQFQDQLADQLAELDSDESKQKYQSAYLAQKQSAFKKEIGDRILEAIDPGLEAINGLFEELGEADGETSLNRHLLSFFMRKAPLLPDADPQTEAVARNQFMEEMSYLPDSELEQELEAALRKKNLAKLHLLRMVLTKRSHPMEADFRVATLSTLANSLPELAEIAEKLEELEALRRDLQGAAEAARTGKRDEQRHMRAAVENYREIYGKPEEEKENAS